MQMKQGRKTSSCEWVVFKRYLRSFVVINKNLSSFENLSDPLYLSTFKVWRDSVTNRRKSLICYSQLKIANFEIYLLENCREMITEAGLAMWWLTKV